jgi:hypothetical protein
MLFADGEANDDGRFTVSTGTRQLSGYRADVFSSSFNVHDNPCTQADETLKDFHYSILQWASNNPNIILG